MLPGNRNSAASATVDASVARHANWLEAWHAQSAPAVALNMLELRTLYFEDLNVGMSERLQ